MRSEEVILEWILRFAESNDEIRAVVLIGSRANPSMPVDILSDYDIMFLVRNPAAFIRDACLQKLFGRKIILQHNIISQEKVSWDAFLMILADGIRIDLSIMPVDYIGQISIDSPRLILRDKDGVFHDQVQIEGSPYIIKKPSQEDYRDTINEFWFCSTNVARGIWRRELSYTLQMYYTIVHPCLVRVLEWQAGSENNWKISTGKFGRFLYKYMADGGPGKFEMTFPGADFDSVWKALFASCDLVSDYGVRLARQLDYSYPFEEDANVRKYLKAVKSLPPDANALTVSL